jgi:NADH dehydrogenase
MSVTFPRSTQRGLRYCVTTTWPSNYFGNANIEQRAFDFKSLLDAIRNRNHVIDCFEHADREPDATSRHEWLTFVVAGGGFAGVELAGALNDFARGILADYPRLSSDDLRVILVHARERILPELSEPLARYALERMSERGVTFKLNTRLADARPGMVILNPAEEIRTRSRVRRHRRSTGPPERHSGTRSRLARDA